MRKRITALALLLCLTLTACGAGKDSQGQTSFLGTSAGVEETAALLTVGRLRGMRCASVLNNVVRWKECISHGVGSYAAGADAAAAGEEHSILAALETFARLEAEKK